MIALILRDVVEADLAVLFEQQCEPEAFQMAHFPPRERDAFMTHWKTRVLGNPSGVVKAIVLEDGTIAGNITSWGPPEHRLVAYWLGKAYWGRGLATAALARFLMVDTTRPLFATVATQNVGSRRVLEKCGFEQVTDAAERARLMPDEDDSVLLALR